MGQLRDAFRLCSHGRLPIPELVAARREGLGAAEERRLRAAVLRGEGAATVLQARDAICVAMAESGDRKPWRPRNRLAWAAFGALFCAIVIYLVVSVASRSVWLGALLLGIYVAALVHDRVWVRRRREATRRALTADRACLQRAGLAPRVSDPGSELEWPPAPVLAAGWLACFALYGSTYGIVTVIVIDDPLTLSSLATPAITYGVMLPSLNLMIARSRRRRELGELHSAESSHQ